MCRRLGPERQEIEVRVSYQATYLFPFLDQLLIRPLYTHGCIISVGCTRNQDRKQISELVSERSAEEGHSPSHTYLFSPFS